MVARRSSTRAFCSASVALAGDCCAASGGANRVAPKARMINPDSTAQAIVFRVTRVSYEMDGRHRNAAGARDTREKSGKELWRHLPAGILRQRADVRRKAGATRRIFTIYRRFYLRKASHSATSAAFRSGGKTG